MVATVIASTTAVIAASTPMSVADIKAQFGNGMPIKGVALPGNATYELTLATDGTATMKLRIETTARTGTWRVSDKGYCSKWGSAAEHCYTIVPNGKMYDVVNSAGTVIAHWTK
jgi:uncharacterized membrane protein